MKNIFINNTSGEIVELKGSKIMDRRRYIRYTVLGSNVLSSRVASKFHSQHTAMTDDMLRDKLFPKINELVRKDQLLLDRKG